MDWYGGSMVEAVSLSKQRNAIFVVFIEGVDNLSQQLATAIDDTAVVKKLTNEQDFLAVKLQSGSENYTHFAKIYQFVPVPSLFFIGRNGTPLEVVCAGLEPKSLADRIDRILEEHRKEQVRPSTSAQSIREQTSSLLQAESSAGPPAIPSTSSESSEPAAKVAKTDRDGERPVWEFKVCNRHELMLKAKACVEAGSSPRAEEASVTEILTTEPPVTEPSATVVLATEPAATVVADTELPTTVVAATEPLATELPATKPPATKPPATELPATEPPATELPATEPPATELPATELPATVVAATEPPATELPATVLGATAPPATVVAATESPATERPATVVAATEPQATVPQETQAASSSTASTSTGKVEDKLEHAKGVLDVIRREKVEKEKELEKEKEMDRRATGQGVAELKRWQADQELKQIQEERKREKLENNLARQRILQQIAQDRAERRARDALPAAVPHPQVEPTQPTDTAGDGTTRARVQFKLPDGSAHTAHFDATAPISDVHAYVCDNLQMGRAAFSLWTAFPRRELAAGAASLRQLRLAPSAALLVLPRAPPAPPAAPAAITFIAQLFATLILHPTYAVYAWLRARLAPRRADPPGPATPPSSRDPPGGSPPSLRRRGNVHRLAGDRSSDDDNNTWNGNSTQQM